jgi:hypothetical protein
MSSDGVSVMHDVRTLKGKQAFLHLHRLQSHPSECTELPADTYVVTHVDLPAGVHRNSQGRKVSPDVDPIYSVELRRKPS